MPNIKVKKDKRGGIVWEIDYRRTVNGQRYGSRLVVGPYDGINSKKEAEALLIEDSAHFSVVRNG